MSEVWLYVNDEPLELGADRIPLTKQAQSLANIDERAGSFTRSFTIPATDHNRRLLENANVFTTDSGFPKRVSKARLVIDGVELGVGNLIVEDNGIMEDTIRLTFYLDSSPFFQLISKLTLWDCPLGVFDHYYNWKNITRGRQPTTISGRKYVYPFIDYGDDEGFFPSTMASGGTSYIRIDRLFPGVYVKDILAQVSAKTGYTFKGAFMNSPLILDAQTATGIWDRLFWPYSAGNFKKDTNVVARYTYTIYNNTSRLCDFNGLEIDKCEFDANNEPIGARDDGGLLPIVPNDFWFGAGASGLWGRHYASDYVRVRVTLKAKISAGAAFTPWYEISGGAVLGGTPNQLNFPDTKAYISCTLTSSGGSVYTGTPVNPISSPDPLRWNFGSLPADTYELILQGEVTVFAAPLTWGTKAGVSAGFYTCERVEYRVEGLYDAGTPDALKQIRFAYPDNIRTWNNTTSYKGGTNYPEVLYPDQVRSAGVTYIALQDNTNVQPPNATYWGAFNSPLINVASLSSSWISGYMIIPDWTIAKFIKGIAQLFGAFILVDERRKEVEFFQLRDLYSNIGNAIDWTDKIVNINRSKWTTRANAYGQQSHFDFTNEEVVGKGVGRYTLPIPDETLTPEKTVIAAPWGATRYKQRWSSLNNGPHYLGIIKRLDKDSRYSGPNNYRLVYLFWYQGNFGKVIYRDRDNYDISNPVTTDQPYTMFTNAPNDPLTLGFDSTYLWHYRWLNYIVPDFRQLTVYVTLTGADLRAVDFRRPVYLKHYNAHFYIQKIKDWLPGEPTAVELIRM